ncbi:MAG TPA: DUF1343 domain-containing protein [Bacteroidota bacterium]|nr:DUF1343 domain-containing protein [Bacteroidota bacterium]
MSFRCFTPGKRRVRPAYRRSGICLIAFVVALSTCTFAQRVKIGAEVLLEKYLDSLAGKRVGIICNQTSVLPGGVHLVDTLLRRGVHITALFAPEHGIRGTVAAGGQVSNDVDPATGIRIYSLYGGTRKPSTQALENVDVLVFDIQDVGARFYTYATTMAYAMQAAAENGKKFIVLDRPNPINGVDLEGPVLDLTLISFVSYFPIPVRHGLTIGELAKMTAGEGFINPSTVDLMVVPMEGWKRSMWYDQTGLPWVAPSPNMKTLATATVYPGTCLLESTNISEGRGTRTPFELIGAPGLKAGKLIQRLDSLHLPGVKFSQMEFTPRADSAADPNPKYAGKRCEGVYLHVTNRSIFKPVLTGIMIVDIVHQLHSRRFEIKQGLFDHLIGDALVSDRLMKGTLDLHILDLFKSQMSEYRTIRKKYLLYP